MNNAPFSVNRSSKGEYNSKFEAITKLYEGVEGANVEQELTADLIGEYLFTDEAFVQQLSAQNRNVFQKIYDEIKYLCKVVSSGSKEAKQLEKVKRAFDKAYKETNAQTNENKERLQYDISEDTELYQYIQDSLDGKISQKKYYEISDTISDKLANDIEKIVGFSVEGYGNKISPNHIQHINDRHGAEGKADHSMKDMHDLAKIRFVIENYDNIREGEQNYQYRNKDNSFAKTVEIQKKIDDGFYYVVEAVPDAKAKTLYVISAYKNKNDTFSEEGVQKALNPNVQNELQPNMSSKNSIPKTTENATKNPKLSLGDDIAPTGKWDVKGSDIVLDDTTPIRKDIAPAQKEEAQQVSDEWDSYEQDDLTDGPFTMDDEESTPEDEEAIQFKEANKRKVKNIQAKIQGLQVSRDVTKKEFSESIEKKKEEYEGLKRKDTAKASKLLEQITNLEYRRDNTIAELDRKIEGQRKAMENIKKQEVARQRKRKQNELQNRVRELIGDTSTWKDKKNGISYQVNTLRRNLRDVG